MRKAINFDLSTKALKEYYPGKHYRNGYRDIEKFLLNNGFKHRQWSGYVSTKSIADYEIGKIIDEMNKELPWLKKCVNHFDVTEVGKQYDMKRLITGNEEVPEKTTAQTKEEKPKPFTIGKKSILSAKSRNQNTQQKQPTKKKEHSLE